MIITSKRDEKEVFAASIFSNECFIWPMAWLISPTGCWYLCFDNYERISRAIRAIVTQFCRKFLRPGSVWKASCMDGWTDRQMNRIMDRQIYRQTDQWMDGYAIYVHKQAKNTHFPIDFVIFTKALPTDRPTDGPTDQRTDIPSYRDAIAASRKEKNCWKKRK